MYDIIIKKKSIVTVEADAIVIPANATGAMQGGVARAILAVAGREIEDDAIAHSPIPIGTAIATATNILPAKMIIHAPITEVAGGKTNEECIRCAMDAAFELAKTRGFSSLAFPGMGTGTAGISFKSSAMIMIHEIIRQSKIGSSSIDTIYLTDTAEDMVTAWTFALQKHKII